PPDLQARSHVVAALRRTRGNKTRAAQVLGITRATLRGRIAAHGITEQEIAQSPRPGDADQPATSA
ncbi:MAG: helix-turn-helix domain-containing protein, partial [Longimicrobiales bacterium]